METPRPHFTDRFDGLDQIKKVYHEENGFVEKTLSEYQRVFLDLLKNAKSFFTKSKLESNLKKYFKDVEAYESAKRDKWDDFSPIVRKESLESLPGYDFEYSDKKIKLRGFPVSEVEYEVSRENRRKIRRKILEYREDGLVAMEHGCERVLGSAHRTKCREDPFFQVLDDITEVERRRVGYSKKDSGLWNYLYPWNIDNHEVPEKDFGTLEKFVGNVSKDSKKSFRQVKRILDQSLEDSSLWSSALDFVESYYLNNSVEKEFRAKWFPLKELDLFERSEYFIERSEQLFRYKKKDFKDLSTLYLVSRLSRIPIHRKNMDNSYLAPRSNR